MEIREARREDLEAIVELLADDDLGAGRERLESPLPEAYQVAFSAIEADPHNALVVAERDGRVLGVLQLTTIPHLTHQGGWRTQIEGVRVAADARAEGIGRTLFRWAIERARERGCHLVQLTTDKRRPNALRFYLDLGFEASHEGMKLRLSRQRES